ncbi:GNAT family N-acetyltransferase [Pseudonocardia sp. KRD-184]|uniref:GNAT family N-acetyltransferase n=1 Tax=Pseudonocardia oceani TaxID=2792013 RepID=A0ABS6U992_9PSEU|nr:GNAT family protein [Pseudonocardia oceani]MBW0091797.1 GNAT family N-acetyltransferase [Pseudonocardia oceani]MBW0098924.1 GNAT family N-acetyltransferase [Pseudonocardia oceani]MBW0109411.1 GNAT family N-acetyltransferase [Pseudonocardia oceani]MBW0123582.1 GNAT family N-acetyltransferase [Pseudonocardia oceani]MBW0128778.1 GNAT family N-acetyltransferase [Pseudonocardia oceani]
MEHWPLRDLVLRTPRLELRPDDDVGLDGLVAAAYAGVHPPEEMPFLVPWTEADPAYLGRGMLQYFWSERARLAPESWSVHFLVRRDGRVIGTQGLTGTDFAVTREVSSGSWLGRAHQGIGLGTEMRAAVLLFAFDHLRARRARSDAFPDNHASHRVSAKLGYRRDGTTTVVRRGEPVDDVRLVVEEAQFVRPGWTLTTEGVDGCLGLLGAA